MEPNANLPDDLEHCQGGAVGTGGRMVSGIAGAADLAKQLVDLGWKNAVIPEAGKSGPGGKLA